MRRRTLLASAFSMGSALLMGAVGANAGIAEDQEAIRDIWVAYQDARVAADADAWLALWDEGGLQLPPGSHPVTKATLDEKVPMRFKPGTVKTMQINPEEIVVTGDWAYSRGTYASDRVRNGEDVHIEGKFMTILKRQDDGSWKIFRDIFNSSPIDE